MLRVCLSLIVIATFAACDAASPPPDATSITFDGVEVEARGDATLRTDGDELVVESVGASGGDGLFLAGTLDAVDVLTAPISLSAGQSFGVSVIGTDGDELAGLHNRARGDGSGRFAFEITYADALNVRAVRVVYFLNGRVVLDLPELPFDAGSGLRLAAESAGEGEGDTDSAHVVRRGGKYVVVSDSESEGGEPRRAGACEGFTITPPVGVAGATLCADRVEVEPLDVSFPSSIAGVAVTGRALGSFRVRELAAR